eukprot:5798443-Prorocentrum_lima.AAC.1
MIIALIIAGTNVNNNDIINKSINANIKKNHINRNNKNYADKDNDDGGGGGDVGDGDGMMMLVM